MNRQPPPNGLFATVWLLGGLALWLNVAMMIANLLRPSAEFDTVRHVVNAAFVPVVLILGHRNAMRTIPRERKDPAETREGAGEVVSERR